MALGQVWLYLSAPIEGMSSWTHRCAHSGTQFFVKMLTEDSPTARCVRSWYVLVNIAVGGLVLMEGHVFRQNLHAAFWLGLLPQVSLLVTMAALGFAFTISVRIRLVQYFRSARQKAAKHQGGTLREYCEPAPNVLRATLLFVAFLAIAAIVLGLAVIGRGREQVKDLTTQCGFQGVSRSINEVQNTLTEFQKKCHDTSTQEKLLVHQCPGFIEAFPEPQPFVDYLARLEVLEPCIGFCTKPTKRFFTKQPSRGAGPRAPTQPCVTLVSQRVHMASLVVGLMGISLGAVLLIGACLLFDYAHL